MKVFAGIEGGGTKFNCLFGSSPQDIKKEIVIPTTSPKETLQKVIDFIKKETQSYDLAAIGVGCFGPLDLNPASGTYGYITSTPKEGWQDTNIVGLLKEEFKVPISFDTDVNAALMGEKQWGAGQNLDDIVFLTVGTGIGGGAMSNSKLIHGMLHTEMGHIKVPIHKDDSFEGCCPFHKNCLEGMASGTAIEERWKIKATEIPPDHPAYELEAYYLACGLVNIVCLLSPQRIIMGGGVAKTEGLLEKVRSKTKELLNGYIKTKEIIENLDNYIIHPALGDRAGSLGSLALGFRQTNN
ncbi:MAG: ROK family protein [Candidatus Caenarcaniphilales bacterium]|nr:ROK family protein [Candidatus Caenarcaniphilales bacterium]